MLRVGCSKGAELKEEREPAAAFAGFTLWRLGEFGHVDGRQDGEACRVLLEYEYPAFATLLHHHGP